MKTGSEVPFVESFSQDDRSEMLPLDMKPVDCFMLWAIRLVPQDHVVEKQPGRLHVIMK